MKTTTLPIAHLDVPITRVESKGDEGVTIIEGYAYVNARVPGDRYNLLRSAMEDATEDYMKWGAIREMHGPNAIGRCVSADWDEKGCKIVAEIVDDQARKKVERGVLKAFSVGVKPLVLRGSDVVKGSWIENSLVDRPKDEDAPFAVIRFEEAQTEGDVTVEVEDDPEEVGRAEFADIMAQRENRILRSEAVSTLAGTLYDALLYADATPETRTAAMDKALDQFRAYISPLMERGESFIEKEEPSEISRAATPLKVELTDEAYAAIEERVKASLVERLQETADEEFVGRRAAVGIERKAPAAAFKPVERFERSDESETVDHAAEIRKLTEQAQSTDDMAIKKQCAVEIGRHQRALEDA